MEHVLQAESMRSLNNARPVKPVSVDLNKSNETPLESSAGELSQCNRAWLIVDEDWW